MKSRATANFFAGLCLGSVVASAAHANPQGAQVAAGQASFANPSVNVLEITNSPGAIINWQQFGIGAAEATRFLQQSNASAVLNRVVGQDPSVILGQLQSNGRVFLINGNGIVFGAGAVVDTAGLVASTLNLSDQDFLGGNYRFTSEGQAGSINNQGLIKVGDGGDVFLIAPTIENSGIIQSDGGDLVLAAGRAVTLTSLDADGVTFEIQAPEDAVVNLGQLLSHGGAAAIFAGTLTHSGDINVDAMQLDERGQIRLIAQADAIVTGTLSARGVADAAQGGSIHVLGERVGLFGQADIDVSGPGGGGEVLVGGDFQGANPAIRYSVPMPPCVPMQLGTVTVGASSSGPTATRRLTGTSARTAASMLVTTVASQKYRVRKTSPTTARSTWRRPPATAAMCCLIPKILSCEILVARE